LLALHQYDVSIVVESDYNVSLCRFPIKNKNLPKIEDVPVVIQQAIVRAFSIPQEEFAAAVEKAEEHLVRFGEVPRPYVE
jgi:protein-disulfide isomerase